MRSRLVFLFCASLILYQFGASISAQNNAPRRILLDDDGTTDSIIDGSIFELDDSLLSNTNPTSSSRIRQHAVSFGTFSHNIVLRYTPNDTLTKDFLIISTVSCYDSLRYEIKRYAEDVHAIYGYGIVLEVVNNANPEDIKSVITSHGSNLCGVMLIGRIDAAYFEIDNDHNKYGYRNWPCDLFYMDLDGIWADNDGNDIYDEHSGNVAPDIFLGRLTPTGTSNIGNEYDLMRNQFTKSHSFWWDANYFTADTVLNYIDNDWINTFTPNKATSIFPSGIVEDVRYSINPLFSPSDYLQRLTQQNYGFIQLAAHSNPYYHQLTNGFVHRTNIENNYSSAYAIDLFCCSACDWTASTISYLGGAYLFNQGKTLSVVGSTKTGGMLYSTTFFQQFNNKSIGEALQAWWVIRFGNQHTNSWISWFYGMTLLGDPTINLRHDLHSLCQQDLQLNVFPSSNSSNHVLFKAGNSIRVSKDFIIPIGTHVVFDAPNISFEKGFKCRVGATFETRNEGCKL